MLLPHGLGFNALLREVAGAPHHLDHLAPVGPGVHHHAAPQGARDAVCKLQAAKALSGGKGSQPGQGHAGTGGDLPLPGALQPVQAGGLQQQGLDPLVRRQQVGAIAQHHQTDLLLPGQTHAGGGLFLPAGQGHQPGRSPNAEGGVAGHRLLFPQFHAGAALLQRQF